MARAASTPSSDEDAAPRVAWTEGERAFEARWRSERGAPPPKRIVVADDTLSADAAYELASQGTAFLWRGDFHNARQLLNALARRVDRPSKKSHRQGARAASAAARRLR